MRARIVVFALLAACSQHPASSPPSTAPATVVLTGGNVRTLDAAGAVATAIAIDGDTIVFVGDDSGARRYVSPDTRVVELAGETVLPGFHDAHTHLLWSGSDEILVDLSAATTIAELLETVLAWADANPDAAWITGGLWDMSIFDGQLDKSQLDRTVPDRPALLWSADSHSAFASSLALELAGITATTPDPVGGRIEHDDQGEPTGVLREGAADAVAALIPDPSDAEADQGLIVAQDEANSYGITTIIDANCQEWILAGYARADAAGQLNLRVHCAPEVLPGDPDNVARLTALRDAYTSDRVAVDEAKFYVDGIIESGTAVMIEPYEDGTNGEPLFTDAELQSAAVALDAAGFQLHAHVIGDGAVRQFLDALDGVVATNGVADRRPLLAHLEVIDPDDVPRLAELGALADFQPLWAYPDSYIQELTWPSIGPQRSEWLYPIRAVADAGGTVVAGSDWSVSSMNPLEGIEVAVTRQDPWENAGPVLTPQHLVSVDFAVRAYTSEAARATFSEAETGTLEVGKRADLVVLDADPYTVDPHAISDIRVVSTWLDGERIYDGGAAGAKRGGRFERAGR